MSTADLPLEARLTCPTCRSRLAIFDTSSGGRTVSVVGLAASVESRAKALERFVAPGHAPEIICPACEARIDPSAPYVRRFDAKF
jgi:uncharacterized protein YbaR (Trm112 family)